MTEPRLAPVPPQELQGHVLQGHVSTSAGDPPDDANSLVFEDVYLLTTHAEDHRAVAGLGVLLDGTGLTVCRPNGDVVATVAWPDISGLGASGRMRTPAAHPGVLVELATTTGMHRFLVPCEDPEAVEKAIVELGRHAPGARARSRRGSRRVLKISLVTALVGILMAGIVLSVLTATGNVTF